MYNSQQQIIVSADAEIPFTDTYLRLSPSGFRELNHKIDKAAFRVGIYIGNQISISKSPVYFGKYYLIQSL